VSSIEEIIKKIGALSPSKRKAYVTKDGWEEMVVEAFNNGDYKWLAEQSFGRAVAKDKPVNDGGKNIALDFAEKLRSL